MKKLMIALAFVGLASTTTAMAQDTEVPTKKYSVATNSFWANWFVSAGVSVQLTTLHRSMVLATTHSATSVVLSDSL